MVSASDDKNPFWRFSLAVYGKPGVADECLAAQAKYDIDVNVLLFCAWLGRTRGVTLSQAELETIEASVKDWHENVVKPLRKARVFTKANTSKQVRALRADIKAHELEAERIEQAMLLDVANVKFAALHGEPSIAAAEHNLALLLARHGGSGAIRDGQWARLLSAVAASDG